MAELKTIITLRQGTTAEWAESDIVLKKGEMGLEYLNNGHVKIKAGDGENLWSALSYVDDNIEAANVFQVELSADDVDDIAAIEAKVEEENATKKNGDVAIVKSTIAGDKISYTSYVYDEEFKDDVIKGWNAMDGNYSANNIVFKDNITLAGSYTAVGNIKKSSNAATGTFAAKGKTLAEVMQSIFTQELYPVTGSSRNLPTITITGLDETSGEVGSSYTLPTATVKVSDVGAYTYGPATGIVFEAGKVTLAQGAIASATNKATNSSEMKTNSTFSLVATDSKSIYADGDITYTFNASGDYTQGAMPVTNLGNDYPSARIDAGTATASGSAKRTGWRNYWYGFISTTDHSTIARNVVSNKVGDGTKELIAGGAKIAAQTLPTITAAEGDRMPVVVFPTSSGKKVKSASMPSSLNAPVTFTKLGTVNLEGYNGYSAVSYDVWGYIADDMPVGADFSIVVE